MRIIGAGLSGLLAGVLNENAEIHEPFIEQNSHQALLRFRSPDIGEAVGIPFKKVTAYKSIWHEGEHTPMNVMMMNKYSRKVSGKISHRSIRHTEAETRWMAPEGFQDMLRNICESRIHYDAHIPSVLDYKGPIISTIPMNVLSRHLGTHHILGKEIDIIKDTKAIYVTRYEISDCEAFMTIYYPELGLNVYRASISGNMLIIECIKPMQEKDLTTVVNSFGICSYPITEHTLNFMQNNGKMSLINENVRKAFILNATLKHNIYSLGRFAVWKDILLDDVYHDIGRIKHFINLSKYDHLKGT